MKLLFALLIASLCVYSITSIPMYDSIYSDDYVERTYEYSDAIFETTADNEEVNDETTAAPEELKIDGSYEETTEFTNDDDTTTTTMSDDTTTSIMFDNTTTTITSTTSTTTSPPSTTSAAEAAEAKLDELKEKFSDKVIEVIEFAQEQTESLRSQKNAQLQEISAQIEEAKAKRKIQLDELNEMNEQKAEAEAEIDNLVTAAVQMKTINLNLMKDLNAEEVKVQDEINSIKRRKYDDSWQEMQDKLKIQKLEEDLKQAREKAMSEFEENKDKILVIEQALSSAKEASQDSIDYMNQNLLAILNDNTLEELKENATKVLENYANQTAKINDDFYAAMRNRAFEDFDAPQATTTARALNYKWIPYSASQGNSDLPANALTSGQDFDLYSLFVIRGVNSAGETKVGKFSARRKEAYIASGDKEEKIPSFEILTTPSYTWIDSSAASDEHKISGVLICRIHRVVYTETYQKTQAYPSGFVNSRNMCVYTHGGNALSSSDYKVLKIGE